MLADKKVANRTKLFRATHLEKKQRKSKKKRRGEEAEESSTLSKSRQRKCGAFGFQVKIGSTPLGHANQTLHNAKLKANEKKG